jgi:hypothetical protein
MAALPSLRFTEERRREQYPGLFGAWGFDEGTGLVAADSSTNGSALTVSLAMTWAMGHSGGTAMQNGGGGGTGGASVAKNMTSTSMTLMGWARPLDLTAGTNRPLFGFWDTASTTGSTWLAIWAQRGDFSPNPANVLQANIRSGGSLNALSGSALTVNVWTHLAVTYDGANMVLYKDGSQVISATQPGVAYTGSAVFCAAPDPANAQIDDVRVFNSALTQAEIQTFMQMPVAVP